MLNTNWSIPLPTPVYSFSKDNKLTAEQKAYNKLFFSFTAKQMHIQRLLDLVWTAYSIRRETPQGVIPTAKVVARVLGYKSTGFLTGAIKLTGRYWNLKNKAKELNVLTSCPLALISARLDSKSLSLLLLLRQMQGKSIMEPNKDITYPTYIMEQIGWSDNSVFLAAKNLEAKGLLRRNPRTFTLAVVESGREETSTKLKAQRHWEVLIPAFINSEVVGPYAVPSAELFADSVETSKVAQPITVQADIPVVVHGSTLDVFEEPTQYDKDMAELSAMSDKEFEKEREDARANLEEVEKKLIPFVERDKDIQEWASAAQQLNTRHSYIIQQINSKLAPVLKQEIGFEWTYDEKVYPILEEAASLGFIPAAVMLTIASEEAMPAYPKQLKSADRKGSLEMDQRYYINKLRHYERLASRCMHYYEKVLKLGLNTQVYMNLLRTADQSYIKLVWRMLDDAIMNYSNLYKRYGSNPRIFNLEATAYNLDHNNAIAQQKRTFNELIRREMLPMDSDFEEFQDNLKKDRGAFVA